MMNLAEAWGLRPDRSNPCYHIRKYKERKRERFLTVEELARLGGALDEEESFAPSAVTAFRLLLYTGARLMEIQTLKWEHIRGDRIHLPDTKTGAKTIPLNQLRLLLAAFAYVLIDGIRRVALKKATLKGISTGDFCEALAALLGPEAPGALGLDHCPPQGGLARRAGALATARSLGQALCLLLGRRRLLLTTARP